MTKICEYCGQEFTKPGSRAYWQFEGWLWRLWLKILRTIGLRDQ